MKTTAHRIGTSRFGKLWSGCVLFVILARGAVQRRPRGTGVAERLRMLPLEDAPLRAPVSIRWNAQQIPAIDASSDADSFAALGIVHAHLRLAQLELLRRVALGRTAEIVGPAGLELDHAVRLLDIARAVPAIADALPDETRVLLGAFVAGINHVIAHAAQRPYEFRVLAIQPEPWTIEHALAVQRLCATDMSWQIWQRLLPLRARMGRDAWRVLWPRLLRCGAPAAPDTKSADAATALFALSARHGSNSMAVSGRRRRSGGALIASDPHLPYSLPSPWIAVSMRSPGFDCAGLMMPSQPFLALGRNRDIAWGGTSLHAQSSDLFDLSQEPSASIRTRTIRIRARGARARRVALREHAIGPVVSDGMQFRNDTPLAMRWLGHRASDELTAMLGVTRARDWSGFQNSLRGFAISGLNMVFADQDGHVGRLCAAQMPNRPETPPPDLVLPPGDIRRWDAIVDSTALPREFDPTEGVVVSANAKPPGGTVPVGFFFAPPDRETRIRACLLDAGDVDIATIGAIQRDVFSRWSVDTRDALLPLLPEPATGPETILFQNLRDWDGHYAETSQGASAFVSLIQALIDQLGSADAFHGHEQVWGVERFVQDALDERDAAEKHRLLADAFRKAALCFSPKQNWGDRHRIRLHHPLAALPLIGKRFPRTDCAAGGSNDTVNKSGHSFPAGPHGAHYGSCARHIADLAHATDSFTVQLGGQDGWIGSANANDQTALWGQGGLIRLPLVAGCDDAEFPYETVLKPAKTS